MKLSEVKAAARVVRATAKLVAHDAGEFSFHARDGYGLNVCACAFHGAYHAKRGHEPRLSWALTRANVDAVMSGAHRPCAWYVPWWARILGLR
jgi:hypothetical protein